MKAKIKFVQKSYMKKPKVGVYVHSNEEEDEIEDGKVTIEVIGNDSFSVTDEEIAAEIENIKSRLHKSVVFNQLRLTQMALEQIVMEKTNLRIM